MRRPQPERATLVFRQVCQPLDLVFELAKRSEELINETHRILVTGVPLHETKNATPTEYAGIYRIVVVRAGNMNFAVPKFVPSQMKDMCSSLKQELVHAQETRIIDRFPVASKYSLESVQIHPFFDGNGRKCCLILNTLLR